MKKLFVLLFIFLSIKIFAQNGLPVYEIKADTSFSQIIDNNYWQMMPDKNNKWTIGEVIKAPLSNNFYQRNTSREKDTIANTYWIRYRLKNVMNIKAEFSLDAYNEQDDFYVFDSSGSYKHFVTGQMVSWQKKDGLKMDNYIPLLLAPNEEIIIYDKAYNRTPGLPGRFAVDIVNTEQSIQRDYVSYVDTGNNFYIFSDLLEVFLIGMLFIAMLINLFSFLNIKEKEYLYFSLLMLFIGIDRLINPLGVYWYFNYPLLYEKIGYLNLSWSFIMLFLVQFIRYFFKLSQSYPRLSKFLLISGITCFVFNSTCEFIDPSYALDYSTHPLWALIFSILQSITCSTVIAVFFIYLRKKSRINRFVIMGGFPLMCLYGVYTAWSDFHIFRYKQYGIPLPAFILKFPFRAFEVAFILWFVIAFSFILFLRFNELRKENAQNALDKERLAKEKEIEKALLIEQQKTELEKQVAERTTELKQSLEELKSTQAQLIQSEKMASLGELTAGIAHEIQNPLNFVNNFSEVNKELINELFDEVDKKNYDEVKLIANDIKDNEEKINHHGKRADAIVKGMLQHSRTTKGVKEPTDINALCDEYLRLSFHGLRAKDKSFNADFKTDFDETIGKINVVPQDIGRVLLNLFNNAFYAVNERTKLQTAGYEPQVNVQTKKINDKVEIVVSDNGNGISSNIIDKIFQPFFTTKPTGQGTGLGLSLSYDIIKAHGGEIKVETKEGERSEFIIQLPITA